MIMNAENADHSRTIPPIDLKSLIVVTDSKGFVSLHEPDEEGNPGDLVASVWRDDWVSALTGEVAA